MGFKWLCDCISRLLYGRPQSERVWPTLSSFNLHLLGSSFAYANRGIRTGHVVVNGKPTSPYSRSSFQHHRYQVPSFKHVPYIVEYQPKIVISSSSKFHILYQNCVFLQSRFTVISGITASPPF